MTDLLNLGVRVPSQIHDWVVRSYQQRNLSKQAFVSEALAKVMDSEEPSLFPADARLIRLADKTFPFRFVDLFAGIGGIRIGLERAGGQCVFSCEKDKLARHTYTEWFGESPVGDICDYSDGSEVPHHHLLAAGFPCQPFSIAGVSKKKSLGREHGFLDKTQGTLFFEIAKIIKTKTPDVVFLENVKNLRSHDRHRTWTTIRETLEQLGYKVFDEVIDAVGYVPQHRERFFIVGFRKSVFGDNPPFKFPEPPNQKRPVLADILQPDEEVDLEKYTLTPKLWVYLQEYKKRHRAKGNGFGFGLADRDGHTRTLSARYYKDGSEVLIPQKGNRPRRLTPVEAARLMGFPEWYAQNIPVSDTRAYKQFGNSVVPDVIEAIARQIVSVMAWRRLEQPTQLS